MINEARGNEMTKEDRAKLNRWMNNELNYQMDWRDTLRGVAFHAGTIFFAARVLGISAKRLAQFERIIADGRGVAFAEKVTKAYHRLNKSEIKHVEKKTAQHEEWGTPTTRYTERYHQGMVQNITARIASDSSGIVVKPFQWAAHNGACNALNKSAA